MEEIVREIKVELGERSYSIFLGYNILSRCVTGLQEFSPEKEAFIVSDTRVYGYYGKLLEGILREEGYGTVTYQIEPGEGSKSWDNAEKILDDMLEKNFSRRIPLLALGGGVVGDLAGFAAALYRRGMPFIQVPTTLLAQVDSSVGGKVAVNHVRGKNMLGTFYQPRAVWADLTTLATLELSEWRAGLAEVLKYALLWDADFFIYLREHAEEIITKKSVVLLPMIERCLQIKAEIVQRDERDEGLRNILNLGHTFGHALEKATNFQKYRHGEAVAVGLAAAFRLAKTLRMVGETEVQEVEKLLFDWGLPVRFPARLLADVLEFLRFDKKVEKGVLNFILPVGLGKVVVKKNISQDIVEMVLKELAE